MNLALTAASVALITILIFLAMWWGWRARTKRGSEIETMLDAPTGKVIADFRRAGYVSTTPEGEPFVRVAIPGLTYKGNADVTVRADGVTISVTGERPVHIGQAGILGHRVAQARVGKAVERDGLQILSWSDGTRTYETSFRFTTSAEQHRFANAISELSATTPNRSVGESQTTNNTFQEDA